MSMYSQSSDDRSILNRYEEYRALSVRERILGHLLVIAVILLAIILQSL